MYSPKDIFDDPLRYLEFFQSAEFEGQCFGRKEVRIDNKSQITKLKENITRCISAFANSNREGGLLVLGVTDNGTLQGTQHVDEQTMNNILQVTQNLKNHTTQPYIVDVPNSDRKQLHLLYTPYAESAICETVADFSKAWKRVGAQNFPLTDQDREQLKRDKRIVDFEISYCCPYAPDELDKGVVEEFKKCFLQSRDAYFGNDTTEEVLYQAGALIKVDDKYAFTNAGYLFFASNPRRHLRSMYEARLFRSQRSVAES